MPLQKRLTVVNRRLKSSVMPLPSLPGPYGPLREFLFKQGFRDRDPREAAHAEYRLWFENPDAGIVVYITKTGLLDVRGAGPVKAWTKKILKAKVLP